MRISKIESARRQLEAAIRLYFHDVDPVAVHTLTAAAYNVIRDVLEATGREQMMVKGQLLSMIRSGMEKKFIAEINRAENFFKHADKDHDQTLEFNPGLTELMLVDAVEAYWKLTGESPQVCRVYQIWFIMKHEEMFDQAAGNEFISVIIRVKSTFIDIGKREFLELALGAMNKQSVGI